MGGGAARRHHWIPQVYLKGFTKDRNKTSQLFVVDCVAKRSFNTPPANIGAQRDFNRVEVEDHDPNEVESAYSSLETQLNDALDRIESSKEFTDTDDRILIFNLIALLAVRNPRMRESMRQAHEHQDKIISSMLTSSKELWESTIRRAVADGYVKPDHGVSYEAFCDFIERGEYEIVVPTTEHVGQELKLLDGIIPYLAKRQWVLCVAPPESGGFLTCDHPVVLKWDWTGEREPPSPPGFAMQKSEVVFPLSRTIALSGVFDGQEGVCRVDAGMVESINGMIIDNADRQVYATNDAFKYLLSSEQGTRTGNQLLHDWLKDLRME
jgi:hypothetical protein